MMGGAKIPILTYHSLDESGSLVSVSPALFAEQMACLAAQGYRSLTLAEATRLLCTGQPVPNRHIVVTFDDGYRSVYTEAFPVLHQYGFTATIFLIAQFCGKHNTWPGHISPVGRRPLMDWHHARELQRYGIELGAHTLTHPDLRQLSSGEAEREIVQSKTEIENQLGTKVHTFAYPYGRYNTEIKAIVEQHFIGACSTRLGRVQPHDDPYALKRLDVFYFRKRSLFTGMPGPILDAYLFGRQRLRDVKNLWI